MAEYQYFIIGGGMTADAAVKGIREIDTERSIGVISAEVDPPYSRPPLTKGLWKGDDEKSIWRHTQDAGVNMILGRTVKSIGCFAGPQSHIIRHGAFACAAGHTSCARRYTRLCENTDPATATTNTARLLRTFQQRQLLATLR
jgi:hypothetical protein